MTKTPEEWLQEISPEKPRGIFKLFLGYAPGVGKTYSMLSEAIRRASRGEDVVVGVVESHGRKATAELAGKLDRVPPRKLEYKGTVFEEMDVDAILARNPAVVVIDELAHTNIEGSKHPKRYEDVIELLEAKIDVLSTMNVQHVESVGPTVQQITGVQVRETVPDWVMQRVDEIVLADLTPQALQKRMERGDIYPVDRAQRALSHFFRPGNLIALRELALRQVTGVVDRSLDAFLEKDGTQPAHTVRERIAVCVSSNPAAQYLIARGSRMGQAIGGEFYVFYIDVGRDTHPEDQKTLAENIRFAENLGATRRSQLRPKHRRRARSARARASHHPGDFRTLGAHRVAALSLPFGHPAISPRFSFRRCPHHFPGATLMADPAHILVVDDEPQITRVLRTSLSAQGYDIRVANSGEMALEIMKDWTPNLIITDLSMPSIDGIQLCRTVRASSQVPIVVLSVRDKEQQKVEALDAGADDYVTKPFGMNELLARVRANLRRVPAEAEADPVIEIGDFRIDTAARRVTVRRQEVRLTPKEFELLVFLARRPGKVVNHRTLLGAIWGGQSTEQVEYLRVFVGQLRKKLEPDASSPRYIVTEPWVGYRFEPGE